MEHLKSSVMEKGSENTLLFYSNLQANGAQISGTPCIYIYTHELNLNV